jgi:hypothetical protein
MNTKDSRKGFAYLKDALQLLKGTFPKTADDVELVIFGKSDPDMLADLPFPVNNRGRIDSESELVYLYNACDVTVLPSVQDNLPNTVMESMACATPVVAFNTSGPARNGGPRPQRLPGPAPLGRRPGAGHLPDSLPEQHATVAGAGPPEGARQLLGIQVAGQYIDVYKSLLR